LTKGRTEHGHKAYDAILDYYDRRRENGLRRVNP